MFKEFINKKKTTTTKHWILIRNWLLYLDKWVSLPSSCHGDHRSAAYVHVIQNLHRMKRSILSCRLGHCWSSWFGHFRGLRAWGISTLWVEGEHYYIYSNDFCDATPLEVALHIWVKLNLVPVQVGGLALHLPGFTHSMLNAPCSSWPSAQLKEQTMPTGWAEAGEEGAGWQIIWTFDGISGTGHPDAEAMKDDC